MHSIDCGEMSPPFFIEKYVPTSACSVLLPKIFDGGCILSLLFGGVGNAVYFSRKFSSDAVLCRCYVYL